MTGGEVRKCDGSEMLMRKIRHQEIMSTTCLPASTYPLPVSSTSLAHNYRAFFSSEAILYFASQNSFLCSREPYFHIMKVFFIKWIIKTGWVFYLLLNLKKGKATATETFGLENRHKVIYRPFSRCYGCVLAKEEARRCKSSPFLQVDSL